MECMQPEWFGVPRLKRIVRDYSKNWFLFQAGVKSKTRKLQTAIQKSQTASVPDKAASDETYRKSLYSFASVTNQASYSCITNRNQAVGIRNPSLGSLLAKSKPATRVTSPTFLKRLEEFEASQNGRVELMRASTPKRSCGSAKGLRKPVWSRQLQTQLS